MSRLDGKEVFTYKLCSWLAKAGIRNGVLDFRAVVAMRLARVRYPLCATPERRAQWCGYKQWLAACLPAPATCPSRELSIQPLQLRGNATSTLSVRHVLTTILAAPVAVPSVGLAFSLQPRMGDAQRRDWLG